jgi:C4-dicarboxylate transporter DctM subunit
MADHAVILALLLLIGLILLEVPIAFSLLIAGASGLLLMDGSDLVMNTLGSAPFNSTSSYSLAVIPMYIVMGSLAARAGLAQDLFDVAQHYLRRVPGGLALAGIFGCAGFSAVTGSSIATVASVGATAVEEMRRHGYHQAFAAGAVAAAGTLGVLIPPSVVIVLLGLVTGTSIASMLLAGIIPGILTALAYGAVATIKVMRHPELAGGSSGRDRAREPVSVAYGQVGGESAVHQELGRPLPTEGRSSRGAARRPGRQQYVSLAKAGTLFTIIVGGVYTGLYTTTEAGGIGALVALAMLLVSRRQSGRARSTIGAFTEAAQLTSSVFFIVVGGAVFTYLLVLDGIPAMFAEWAVGLPVPGIVLVVVVLLAMIPLGMILDSLSIVLVFVPIVFPIVEATGFHPVVFGILCVKMIEIGMITPPVGMNVFVISATQPSLKAEAVFRSVVPFIVSDVILVGVLLAFPDIVLFLPEMVGP